MHHIRFPMESLLLLPSQVQHRHPIICCTRTATSGLTATSAFSKRAFTS